MTDPLDLDAMERGSLSSTARRLIAELRQTRKERDEALEKVHFYEVQYQDEIGINGLIEERDAALATVMEQKAEIERPKLQLEDELVTSSQSDRERAKQLIKELCGGEPVADDDSDIEPTARVLAAIRREERRASLTDAADWLRRYGRPDAAEQMLREVAADWDWPASE